MEVVIHIPDDIAQHLQAQRGDIARYVLECVACAGYRDGVLNEEHLQRLLGYDTLVQVHAFLKEHDIPLRGLNADKTP
jgi:Uncharacterised protein family (UPF0175)